MSQPTPSAAAAVTDANPITVAVDTNVFLDIHSCHDLVNDVEKLTAMLGDADKAFDHPDVRFRIIRARESTLLAIYFNKMKTSTWSLHTESTSMLGRFAPPETPGGQDMRSDFTRTFVHYVKDHVLPGWNPFIPAVEDHVKGDAADLALLEYAEVNGVPIVTNEGVTINGITEAKRNNMRRRGRLRGVRVLSPREFYGYNMEADAEIEAFLRRFRAQARGYLERRGIDDAMKDVIIWIHGYYRLILLGEVEGRDTPLLIA
jgi:hypothetical protein